MVLDSGREILDSWKQIAQYLHREVRTCYRWWRELGLPVHRIDEKSAKSKVFAYKDEIDQWLKDRSHYQALPKNGVQSRKRLIYGGLAFTVIFGIAAVIAWSPFFSSNGSLTVSIAGVRSPDPSGNQDYLSEEIARAIAKDLPVPKRLSVIPTFRLHVFEGLEKDGADSGNGFNADYILNTEVKKWSPTTRLIAELVRTDDGRVVWRSEYVEPLEKSMTIPPRICAGIHGALKVAGTSIPQDGLNAREARALDSYLKGDFILGRLNTASDDPWQFYHQGEYYVGRFTPEANELAIKLFSQAIELDSAFAPAYIGLASCYSNYVNFNWQFDISWLNKAEDLLEKAQALSPNLPEYFSALITVLILKEAGFEEDTWAKVGDLVSKAVDRSGSHPRLSSIVGYYFYKKFGREGDPEDFRKALEYKERSFWVDPYDVGNVVYANLLMLSKEFNKALEICAILEKVDETGMSTFLKGEILYYMGDLGRSQAVFMGITGESLEFRIGALCYLAMISACKGDIPEARNRLAEIENISPDRFVFLERDLKIASIRAGIGDIIVASQTIDRFLNDSRFRKDIYIYKMYFKLDKNFRQLDQVKSLRNNFN